MLQPTNVTSVVEVFNGKEIWLNTNVFIPEKNSLSAQCVGKSLRLVKLFCTTSSFTLAKSPFNALFVETSTFSLIILSNMFL